MDILIVYGTTEGQTRKIVRFLTDRFRGAGHAVTEADAADGLATTISDFDRVILAASVHAGRYQSSIVHLARANHDALTARRAVFLSISLTAASDDVEERQGLEECVEKFAHETGWTPNHVEHVAGAFRFTQYDFFKGLVMRSIAARHNIKVARGADLELTDWDALACFANNFAGPPGN
ncbi:MAG: hypothetical protein KDJ77_04265 [Rhodobiaceae bacterium]|nr:hypothetical protein [Rhodobiaceae bacterium]